MPEIDVAINILQGLSLLSRSCKEEVGERWAMEVRNLFETKLTLRCSQICFCY